ncbi:MAG: thymidine kinase [Gelidibacter sp.]|nr:thymidine kinase [Gelidibacter sp.]
MFLENTVNPKEQFGWIEVICGSMFSGKTEELIRRLKRAQFAKQRVEIFKPAIDVRYDDEMVVSHDANEIRSTPVPAAANIPILADGCDVVGIDEAQFFDDEIVRVCNDLANKGVRVIVAGLDMDFKGNPFGPMPALMATAEYVTKVHAICTRTGNLAQYSYRKAKSDALVLLGEVDEYEPLSRAAFYKAMLRDKVRNMNVTDAEEVNNKPKNSNA